MKLALFSAVPEEVGGLREMVNFTGIGRENATRTALAFFDRHRHEDFITLNVGTVGAHHLPVGTILSVSEIVSSGTDFTDFSMKLDTLPATPPQPVSAAVLFSSDSFVSKAVYTDAFLQQMMHKADCFDMESSALYSVASFYGKKYVSYKIVSDNLDVTIEVWRQRVVELSAHLELFLDKFFEEIRKNEPLEFLK